ncbi:MAG: hypothetical protein K9L28_01610 [Synergistales bacterium]|nr:hypothetical protein [Synergistales bacterium]
MKIAVVSDGEALSSQLGGRFARGGFVHIVDTDTDNVETFRNDANDMAHGAGGRMVQNIASAGATAALAPRVGPKAASALRAAEIAVYEVRQGTGDDAVEAFKAGRLKELPL